MADLSPAAQAVLNKYRSRGLSAAVYSLADQVLPYEPEPDSNGIKWIKWFCNLLRFKERRRIRNEILIIAAELDNTSPTH
jgi:hypothetical protein